MRFLVWGVSKLDQMDLEILENPRPAVSATKKVSQKHLSLCCGSNSYKIVCWEVGEPLTFEHFGWFWMISNVKKKKRKNQHTGNSFPDLGGAQQLRSGSNIILAGGGWGFLSRFVEINYWIGCFTQIQVDCLEISWNHMTNVGFWRCFQQQIR